MRGDIKVWAKIQQVKITHEIGVEVRNFTNRKTCIRMKYNAKLEDMKTSYQTVCCRWAITESRFKSNPKAGKRAEVYVAPRETIHETAQSFYEGCIFLQTQTFAHQFLFFIRVAEVLFACMPSTECTLSVCKIKELFRPQKDTFLP